MSSLDPPIQPGGGGAPEIGQARLTETEQKLIARLLSDPTYFPIEFRVWLKQFFESSGITITRSQIVGGGGSNVATELPAGIILACAAGGAVPVDTLPCDGTTRVRSDFPALFTAIGVVWGVGDGTTTFNLPDLRDRALYGQGSKISAGATDGVASGSRGGPDHYHNIASQTTTAAGSHSHGGGTGNNGAHSHSVTGAQTRGINYGSVGFDSDMARAYPQGTSGVGDHAHSISADGSHTHSFSGYTTGGYALHHGSYAGVIFAITTGGVS